MGDINFWCGRCGQPIIADSNAAGLQADCPNCWQTLTIPGGPLDGSGEDRLDEGGADFDFQLPGMDFYDRERFEPIERERPSMEDVKRLERELSAAKTQRDRVCIYATASRAELCRAQSELQHLRAELWATKTARDPATPAVEGLDEIQWRGQALAAKLFVETLQADLDRLWLRMAAGETQLELKEQRLDAQGRLLEGARDAAQKYLRETSDCLADLQAIEKQLVQLCAVHEQLDPKTGAGQAQPRQGWECQGWEFVEIQRGRQLLELREQLADCLAILRNALTESALVRAETTEIEAENDPESAAPAPEKTLIRGAELRRGFGTHDIPPESAQADLMEELVEEQVEADNAMLRGIIARQNMELVFRLEQLKRLKRERFGLRIIYALISLGVVALVFLALDCLAGIVF